MKLYVSILIFCLLSVIFAGCEETPETDEETIDQTAESPETKVQTDAEAYVMFIDTTEWLIGSSLYYTNEVGGSEQVFFWMDDNKQIKKMEENYSVGEGATLQSKLYYYKDGFKYVTKEYFEKFINDTTPVCVERVSYYDQGKPVVTKERESPYQENLDKEAFKIVDPHDLDEERAMNVLNQQGEFETTYQGYVKDGHMTFILVGPNTKDGYVSSLAVQYFTPLVNKLIQREVEMIGTPLNVEFTTTRSDLGFEFQALLSVSQLGE